MSVTIEAAKYPALSAGAGVSGKRQVLYINYGTSATAAAPVWNLVGGITEHSLSISAEVATSQTKDTGYWASGAVTSKSAELSASVIFVRDNLAQAVIEQFVLDDDITAAKNALNMAIVDLDTDEYLQFWAIPSSWETTASSEDMITKDLSATIVGEIEQKTGFDAD